VQEKRIGANERTGSSLTGFRAGFGPPFFIMNEHDTFEERAIEALEMISAITINYGPSGPGEVDLDDLRRRLNDAIDEHNELQSDSHSSSTWIFSTGTTCPTSNVNWQQEGF